MNDSPFDSLISAFYDGELNDADRQAVEHRLADDADARRELADYGQLSDLLQELDREPLPEEFTAQVLQRLERRTLLPQPATPRHPRVWAWSALVPLLATAAVLLLMWAAPRSNDDRLLVENRDNDSRSTSRDVDVVMFESGGALGGLGPQSSQRLLKRPPSEVPGALPAPSGPVADAWMSDEPAAQTASGRRNLAMMTEFGFSAKVKVQDFEVGSVIQAIETSPSGVAVVQLWVVDRQEGLDKLQLLLARNDVSEDEFGVTTKLAAVTDKSARRSKSVEDEKVVERLEGKPRNAKQNESLQQLPGLSTSDGLVAIYVEAPREKLAEVLKGLQSERAFVEVNTQPTNAETALFAAIDHDRVAQESAPSTREEPAKPEEPAPQTFAKSKASANGRSEDRKELLGRQQALAEHQVAATDSYRKSRSGVHTAGD
ncbi:MAG TPA: hypothetical protein VHB77_11180, partial [Planctomycetaceae bacterium]|nr:hypothetical protein [Planctomycetaceae bacterium]